MIYCSLSFLPSVYTLNDYILCGDVLHLQKKKKKKEKKAQFVKVRPDRFMSLSQAWKVLHLLS